MANGRGAKRASPESGMGQRGTAMANGKWRNGKGGCMAVNFLFKLINGKALKKAINVIKVLFHSAMATDGWNEWERSDSPQRHGGTEGRGVMCPRRRVWSPEMVMPPAGRWAGHSEPSMDGSHTLGGNVQQSHIMQAKML